MKLELKASLPIEDIICSEDNVDDRTGDINRILGHDVITVSTEDASFLFVSQDLGDCKIVMSTRVFVPTQFEETESEI